MDEFAYRVHVPFISLPIHYIPRDIVGIIEGYVPLEDLSDSDQAARVRKIAWPTTSKWEDVGQRTTAFEHDNAVYWIIHEGNKVVRLHGPTQVPHHCLYAWPHEEIKQISNGLELLTFTKRVPSDPSFTLSNCCLRNPLDTLDPSFHSLFITPEPRSSFLYHRAQWIMKQIQSLLRIAEVIVSHLHPYDKYQFASFR